MIGTENFALGRASPDQKNERGARTNFQINIQRLGPADLTRRESRQSSSNYGFARNYLVEVRSVGRQHRAGGGRGWPT